MDKSSLFYPDSKKIIYSWLMAFGLTWPVASQNQCLGQSPSSWLPKSEAWAIGHSKPPYGSSLAWLLMPGLGWLLAQSQGREITSFKRLCELKVPEWSRFPPVLLHSISGTGVTALLFPLGVRWHLELRDVGLPIFSSVVYIHTTKYSTIRLI